MLTLLCEFDGVGEGIGKDLTKPEAVAEKRSSKVLSDVLLEDHVLSESRCKQSRHSNGSWEEMITFCSDTIEKSRASAMT